MDVATKQEIAQIEQELGNISHAIMTGISSPTVLSRLNARMAQLMSRKKELGGLPEEDDLAGWSDWQKEEFLTYSCSVCGAESGVRCRKNGGRPKPTYGHMARPTKSAVDSLKSRGPLSDYILNSNVH